MPSNHTSWENSARWYTGAVGEKGHYYHQHVVIPGALRLLNLSATSRLLDLACGQGILARALPPSTGYLGLDLSESLIKSAQKLSRHEFRVADVSKPLSLSQKDFTHAAIILALQNINHPEITLQNASRHLAPSGRLLLVLNHPCFRIPRQSSWGIDPGNQLEYRRINRYLSPLKIPISTHPGDSHSPLTWSFHQPLSAYFAFLKSAGFVVDSLEEWTSDKESVGQAAKMENRARSEFPLFMAILARKL
jgi:SAM-dependent methyltransferase